MRACVYVFSIKINLFRAVARCCSFFVAEKLPVGTIYVQYFDMISSQKHPVKSQLNDEPKAIISVR